MSTLFSKIRNDVWHDRWRTFQVVAIVAAGATALGMILGTRNLVIAGMEKVWRESSPAVINLEVNPRVDEDTLSSLRRIPGVSDVEGVSSATVEWRPDPDSRWRPANLIARSDYERQSYAKLTLLSGNWPHKKALAIGQGCDAAFGIHPGQAITLRINDREVTVKTDGAVYDPNIKPPSFGGNANFYITRDVFADLTGSRDFNQILAGVDSFNPVETAKVADRMQSLLENQKVESFGAALPDGARISDPKKHFFQDIMDGIFFILEVMAVLALILSLFLVYNTITAIIQRQINQIGIMKAVGARTRQIAGLYFINVLIYGLLALAIAIPLGAIASQALGVYLLHVFNADSYVISAVSPSSIIVQVVISLAAPLAACAFPIYTGSRITVHQAINTYGLNARPNLVDRCLARIRALPQLASLAVSNTFRHKQRVILTQITLVLSGVIFIIVVGARDAASYTYGQLTASILRFNVCLEFQQEERIARIESIVRNQPGVKAVELWQMGGPTIRPAGSAESDGDLSALAVGMPIPTSFYIPQIRKGRWLAPGDSKAVVLNQKFAKTLGVTAGDRVTMHFSAEKESDWVVVGLLFDPILNNLAVVPRDALLLETGSANRANTIWVQTARNDAAGEEAVAKGLRNYFDQNNIGLTPGSVFGSDTASQIVDAVMSQFSMIVVLLSTMAVLIGVVGSIALGGVLSLNVMDRRREIGVMRAIGASSGDIAGICIGEGLILGWLSWLIALPLAIPAGNLLAIGLGAAMRTEMFYHLSFSGVLLWLFIITILSALASGLPARSAIRVSVRESLSYE